MEVLYNMKLITLLVQFYIYSIFERKGRNLPEGISGAFELHFDISAVERCKKTMVNTT